MANRDRKNLNITRRREALREELKTREYLRQIHGVMDKAETADPSELPGLKLKAECAFKLLAKTLPDLKATELSVDPESAPIFQIVNYTKD